LGCCTSSCVAQRQQQLRNINKARRYIVHVAVLGGQSCGQHGSCICVPLTRTVVQGIHLYRPTPSSTAAPTRVMTKQAQLDLAQQPLQCTYHRMVSGHAHMHGHLACCFKILGAVAYLQPKYTIFASAKPRRLADWVVSSWRRQQLIAGKVLKPQ
jgi:hypothetical protein